LNYAGKFDATISSDGEGGTSHSHFHVDSVQGHAPADAIIVPDAHFLFHADFKRSGLDLVLHNDDHELVLHDYFKGDKRAALASPDGAHLTGDIVNALTGSVDVAQAGGPAAAGQIIGHVTKLVGNATVVRNGVSIILNMGDNVEKGDVVLSGSDSTLGITFIDGTVFGLSSNARMVLNEMVYDPNGSNNSSLLSLVAGTITFVAGETAKHGDMKVDTPVATMGIRGTAVLVEIDFTVPGQGATPDAHFQVLVEPDGTTGSYILFDKTTLQPLAVVNQAGQQINISNGVLSQSSAPLSPDVEKLIQDVFTLKFSANDTNPKTTTAQTDTTNPLLYGPVIKLANGTTATPIFQITAANGDSSPTQNPTPPSPIITHIPEPPKVAVNPAASFAFPELAHQTHDTTDFDTVGGTINFVDVNAGDLPTVSVALDHIDYKGALVDGNFQLISGLLSSLELKDIEGTGIAITLVPASTNNNNGSATWTYSVPDAAFDFLAAGETLVLTYTVKVDNNYTPFDQVGTATITITITGTNDAPVITTSAPKIDFSGGQHTPGGTLTSSDPTSGKLDFTDVDLDDTHKVAVTDFTAVMSNGTQISQGLHDLFKSALTVSLETDSTGTGNGVVDWQLEQLPVYLADFIPKGQTLTLTYTVGVTDSQGVSDHQSITVTITGTDSPAVVWIATTTGEPTGASWNKATNWETDTVPTATDDVVIITDQLIGLKPNFPVTIDADGPPAFAHSLTMNDYAEYSGLKPPELDNSGALTIGGQLLMYADSVLRNYNVIAVGGAAEFHDTSLLENVGTLLLENGGEFADSSRITNEGAIQVIEGTLDVSVEVSNLGQFYVDARASLVLNSATIDGGDAQGTVSIAGTLDLEGTSFLSNGALALTNGGQVNVTGMVVFDNEVVTNNESGAIDITGALTLQNGSSITNGEGNTETVESEASLTLQGGSSIVGGELINLGTVYVETSAGATFDGVRVDNDHGTIHVDFAEQSATLILDNGTSVTGGHLDIGGAGTLEVSTAAGATLSGVTVENSGFVQVDEGAILALAGSTIDNGALVNDGTINSTGTSAIDGADITNDGVIEALSGTLTIDPGTLTNSKTLQADGGELDISGETVDNTGTVGATGGGVLKLISSTIDNSDDGAVTVGAGSTLDLDHSGISGGTLTISGTLDNLAGINTITSAITEIGSGSIVVSGGSLDLAGPVAGDVTITGDSTVELSATGTSAYAETTVVFGTGATGTLVLDHAGSFTGTIAGLDDNTIDLADISYASKPTVSYANGVLSVFVGGVDVANLDLTGDYSGVHWVLGEDGSGHTTVTEAPGAIAGLDANGNADQGAALSVSITDGGAAVTGATYDWQVSTDGVHWTEANGTNGQSSYTPVEADEGESLRVSLSFTDSDGNQETSTVSAGVVQEIAGGDLVATLSSHTARQGVPIKITEVTDGGLPVTTGLAYAWQVSSDGGKSWSTVGTASSFTPGEAQEGKLLQLVVTYKDASGSESATYDLGMPDDLVVALDSTSAHQGVPIDVTRVTDGDIVVRSGLTYSWQISSDGQDWTTVGTKSSYTPGAGDDGKLLQLAVTYVDPGEHESVTTSLGLVTADSHWTGGSHAWESATHWTPSGIPTSDDDVIIDARGEELYTVTIDQASAAHSLLLDSFAARVDIVRGGTLTLGGDAVFTQGTFQVDSGGTLKDVAASATISGSFTANGTVEAGGGKLEIAGSVAGTGSFKIDAGATLQLDHANSHDVVFSGSGELILKDPAHYSGIISDASGSMTEKDVLDLAGFDTDASVQYIGDTSGGILKISEAHHATAYIKVGANSTNWSTPVSDGHGGILIHDPPATDSPPSANADAAPKPDVNADGLWSATEGASFVFKIGLGRNLALDSGHSADPAQPNHQDAAGILPLFIAGASDAQADLSLPPGSGQTNTPESIKALLLAHHDFHFV
jgi:VCBS repeat-containing protein